MDFALTEDQRLLRDTARQFANANLVKLADELEVGAKPVPPSWLKQYAEMGFLGINTAESDGGLGLSLVDALLVIEELAKVSVAVAFPVFECCVGPLRVIDKFGSEELRTRLIRMAINGEGLVSMAMSEPDAGTAVTDLRTRAIVDGDVIRIEGAKRWCSGAGHAAGYVVLCRFGDIPGAKGIGAVFVPGDAKGLTFGAQEDLMGFRGVPSADMYLDGVKIPTENLLIQSGGFASLMGVFNVERLGNATMALGVAAGALERSLQYVQERMQFGKPLVDFQAVQLRLAEMTMKVEAARLLIHKAATEFASNNSMTVLLAKCFANEITREVTGAAVQLMGAYGYARAYGMERRMRDAWGWGIAGGSIDIQKVNITSALVGRRFDQRR